MLTVADLDNLVTVSEGAERLGISQGMIRNWADRGRITRINPPCRQPCAVDHQHVAAGARPYFRLIDIARAERDSRRRLLRGRQIA